MATSASSWSSIDHEGWRPDHPNIPAAASAAPFTNVSTQYTGVRRQAARGGVVGDDDNGCDSCAGVICGGTTVDPCTVLGEDRERKSGQRVLGCEPIECPRGQSRPGAASPSPDPKSARTSSSSRSVHTMNPQRSV